MNQLVTAHKILTFTNNTLGNNQAARNKRLVMGAHTNANFKVNSKK